MDNFYKWCSKAAFTFFCSLSLLLWAVNSFAQQPGTLDATFNPADTGFGQGDGPNGPVHSVILQPDNKILIGGSFGLVNDVVRNDIARLNADGSLDQGFAPIAGTNGQVYTVALQPNNKVLIGGTFTLYNNLSRNRIARLNSDGTLDATFNPGTGFGGATSSTQVWVNAIVVQPDGKILVAGSFTTFNGVTWNRLVRLNADGTFDPSFNPGTGANGVINAMALQPDGKILIGGGFGTYNGTNRVRIARLNSDGSLDVGFTASANNSTTSVISSIVVQPDNKILLGGTFTFINNIARNNLARLNSDGTLDTSFTLVTDPSANVLTLALQPDGKIVLGGLFTTLNGQPRSNIARLNIDGSLDQTYSIGSGADNKVLSLAFQTDGKLLASGEFILVNSVGSKSIARLNSDGNNDMGFNTVTGANDLIRTTYLQVDGKLIIAGDFTRFNNISRNRIARLMPDGTLDMSFDPGSGANGAIYAVDLQLDGKIVIGGEFYIYDGQTRVRTARLNPDGSLDSSFDPILGTNGTVHAVEVASDGFIILGGNFNRYNNVIQNRIVRVSPSGQASGQLNTVGGIFGTVHDILEQPDGKLLIAGEFTSVGNVLRNRIARFNMDGTVDLNFFPGTGANNVILNMALQPDGMIIIGGDFTTFNGTSRQRVARIYSNGNLDPAFVIGSGFATTVNTVSVLPEGKVLVGGTFTSALNTPRNRVAVLQANGSLDLVYNLGTGASGPVHTSLVQPDGKIVIAGNFTSYNGTGRNRIARLNGLTAYSINTGTISSLSLCGGESISVPFTTSGTFATGNIFSAQLSDASGSFNLPVTIGNLTGTGSGIINAVIPASTIFGSGYRIRVIANYPYTATASTSDITVHSFPNIAITAADTAICLGNSIILNAAGGLAYTWLAGPGLSAQNGGSVTVTPPVGVHTYTVVTTSNGCSDSATFTLSSRPFCLDIGFATTVTLNEQVTALVTQPDGKILIGGRFTAVNGISRNRIARLNVDGTLDQTFNPGSGVNADVNAIELYPDGRILIAGAFTQFNGSGAPRIVRLLGNGVRDFNFSSIGTGASSFIFALQLLPNGKIVVGGSFDTFNGQARNGIVQINENGSIDNSFTIGSGASSNVRALAVQPDGKILVGGEFNSFSGAPYRGLVRLNTNGLIDVTFPQGLSSSSLNIYSLALQPDGRIIIGGDFTSVSNINRNRIARLNSNGTVDMTFDPGAGANATVETLLLQQTGKIVVGGRFTNYNGSSYNRIVRLNTDGTHDTGFYTGTGPNSDVLATAMQPDGKVIIGGRFTSYNGVPVSFLARISGEIAGTLSVGTMTYNTLCLGTTMQIPVTTTVNFPADNVFTAQLSDFFGNFNNPLVIGTLASGSSGNMTVNIPASLPPSSAYRIRILATYPYVSAISSLFIVTANPLVSATASPASICTGSSTSLSGFGAATYSWSNGQNGQSLTVSPPNTTTYSVTGTNVEGCTATAALTVIVTPVPVVNFAGLIACTGSTVTLSATGTTGASYNWTGPGNFSSAIQFPQLQNLSSAMAGTYSVTVSINGCPSLPASGSLSLLPAPTASFTLIQNGCCGVSLSNTSAGGTSYSYNFGDGSAVSTLENPTHQYAVSGNYIITQTVTNAAGCTATYTQNVSVVNGVATAISPAIQFYPNPTAGYLTIKVPEVSTVKWLLEVQNMLGQVMLVKAMPNGIDVTELDMTHLAEGSYFVRVVIGNQIITRQVVVQR